MKLVGIIIFMSSLLMSSCAFMDGLKNNSDGNNGKQRKPVKAAGVGAVSLPNNNGTVQAAKTIAPITHE